MSRFELFRKVDGSDTIVNLEDISFAEPMARSRADDPFRTVVYMSSGGCLLVLDIPFDRFVWILDGKPQ